MSKITEASEKLLAGDEESLALVDDLTRGITIANGRVVPNNMSENLEYNPMFPQSEREFREQYLQNWEPGYSIASIPVRAEEFDNALILDCETPVQDYQTRILKRTQIAGLSGKRQVMEMVAGLSALCYDSEPVKFDSMRDMHRDYASKPNPIPSEHKRAELRKKRKAKKRR